MVAINLMPKYVYKCRNCDGSFTTFHGMTDDQDYCELCDELDCVFRIPQMPSVKLTQNDAGKIVREYIEDAKKELQAEKKRLQQKEYGKQ